MSSFLIIGLFFSSAVTLYAQAQQPNTAKLKVDAQVVSIIREDKAKTQAYCQINCLGGEIWSTCSDSKAVGGPEPTALRSSPIRAPDTLGCRTESEESSFTDARSDLASVLRFKSVFTATKCRIADLSSPPIFICLALHCRRFQIFDLEPATHRLAQSQKGGRPIQRPRVYGRKRTAHDNGAAVANQ